MSAPQEQSDWTYGISASPMSAYTDDSANPTTLEKFVSADQQAAQVEVMTGNNEGESTGTDWATEQWTEKHDVNIPFNINPSITMLGRILLAAFGQKATSSPSTGVTKDIFTPQDPADRQLPAWWFCEKCADVHDATYPSCVLEKATFKGDDTGKLNVSGNFRGSGRQILGAGITINNETNKYYLKNTMSKIVRATAATPGTPVQTYACGLQSWMFDVDNAPDQNKGYDPGCQRFYTAGDPDSGIIRSFHTFGKRKYSGQFVIWLENSAPELALLRSQAELDIKMGMTGKTIASTYKNLLEFEMHLAHYKAVQIGNKNGGVTMEITPEAFYNESLNKIVSVTLQHAT